MIQKLKDDDVEIRASSVDIEEEDEKEREEEMEDLLDRNPDLQGSNQRDPRFQIYWLTTTKYVYLIGHRQMLEIRSKKSLFSFVRIECLFLQKCVLCKQLSIWLETDKCFSFFIMDA